MHVLIIIFGLITFTIIFYVYIAASNEPIKKEVINCDCCGEDLATAHTV